MCDECDSTCLTCGKGFKQSGKGRPRDRCSPTCTNLHKFFNAMHSEVLEVQFTPEGLRYFRGDLFRLANEIKTIQDRRLKKEKLCQE